MTLAAQGTPPLPSYSTMRPCLFAVMHQWTAWLGARDMAERTIDAYWRYLLAAAFFASKDPRDFTEADVVQVIGCWPARGGGRAMVIRAMRSFFSWAEDAEMTGNPTRRITVPRSKFGPAPRLSRDELEAMWQAAQEMDPRAKPTLMLLYFTGARVGSLCGVQPEHIRSDREGNRSIYFAVTKGDFPYELPLSPEAGGAVDDLLALLDWKPKMAVARRPTLVGVGEATVWKWVSEAGKRVGIHAYPHLARHTFASDLAADADVDVRTWVEAMNHRDGSQLRRYAAASEPRVRAALGRLGSA